MSKIKVAFMFLAPDGDPKNTMTFDHSAMLDLVVVPVKDYREAATVSKQLVEDGILAIELCAGFGNLGLAKVCEAVAGKVPVGAVRFDSHPIIGQKGGDEIFNVA